MAKQENTKRRGADVWADIDSSVASLVGQRVFYNYNGQKCLAFVTAGGYERDKDGHIQNTLVVYGPGGVMYPVQSFLSSDRIHGSFDLAHDGDLTDSGTVEHEPAPVEVSEEAQAPIQPLEENSAVVDNGSASAPTKEEKRAEKPKNKK